MEKAENTAVKAWTNTKEFEALVAKEDEAPLRFSLMRQASSDMLLELGITTINDILSEATIDLISNEIQKRISDLKYTCATGELRFFR